MNNGHWVLIKGVLYLSCGHTEIVETEDLTYTTVAHTPSEADITCIADITVISHAKQRRTGTGVSHSYNMYRVLGTAGGDFGGGGPTGGMLVRHGPPSDFGPYHAIAV